MKLQSLNDIFERRILRIPDYQRGYAWGKHQLISFWEDMLYLESDRNHYTGVITLEPVKEHQWRRWDEDEWIIDGMEYRPFYLVDGQQRLTTSIILLQTIIESVNENEQLNYQSVNQIRSRYILTKAEDGERKSFLFGYEKDNPSDSFLKHSIFDIQVFNNPEENTLYTQNLKFAKDYFKDNLSKMDSKQISILFKKLTQKFKFNLYEIDDEIDVFVAFETMNNRGKPLTNLELLKNRLIYLSTLFTKEDGAETLRKNINDTWKTIYAYLGKNASHPLDDDDFLKNHWIMYFKYSRKKGDDYIKFLLDEKFTANNITIKNMLSLNEISNYIASLRASIKPWFYIHNPYYSGFENFSNDENKIILNRLQRLGFRAFKPMLLAAYVLEKDSDEINSLLATQERYNFTIFALSRRRANTGDSEFYSYALELLNGSKTISEIINIINKWTDDYFDKNAFLNYIIERYEIEKDGFYGWSGLRYFLYEYEQSLRIKGKQSSEKLSWKTLNQYKRDHITIEHIYPQTPDDECWNKNYNNFDMLQQLCITHSLGNLIPLSSAKNASLQNDCFTLKKNNNNGVGYYNGSLSENEIAQKDDWLVSDILKRGLSLLEFLERRWSVELGDEEFKKRLLNLEFLNQQ